MLIESFLKYIRYELNLSAYTVLSYRNDLEQFQAFLTNGQEPLDAASITENDIRAWMVSLSAVKDSPRTIRRKIQSLRTFFTFLMKRGITGTNPAKEIELAKFPQRLPSYMRQSSMDRLLDEPIDTTDFKAVRDRLIILMFYTTGIRRAELISLRDVDVDTEICEMKVHGKRDKDRIIPFGQELRDSINSYRDLRKTAVGNFAYETLFVRPDGRSLSPAIVYAIVHKQLAEVGGASKYSPHVLRHTFASAMLNNGAEINSVKEILGHESLATTQVYTHITFSELKSNYKLAHPRALKKGG